MIEVYPHIYRETIPLPNSPLKSIHIYIVKGAQQSLIIDTGFNEPETSDALFSFIDALHLRADQLLLFLTHLHSDHTGLAPEFAQRDIPIYMSEVDGERLLSTCQADSREWQRVLKNAIAQGLECDRLDLNTHPGFRFRPKETFHYQPVRPGDVLKIPPYDWTVIDEAGHTPGMIGLYEPTHQLLFCGDHILGDITPNITYWNDAVGDSLGTYLKNLQAIRALPIKQLFTAHRTPVTDVNARINALQAHHKERLAEVLSILKTLKKGTVRDVAMRLKWQIRAKSWADFPDAQKWFAAGEAHAHLEHLHRKGQISCHKEKDVLIYSLL